MKVNGESRRTIWLDHDSETVRIIDQVKLPHRIEIMSLTNLAEVATVIRDMHVRGAPLIGVTAAYGVALAMRSDPTNEGFETACRTLAATRPTAINLMWALDEMRAVLTALPLRLAARRPFGRPAISQKKMSRSVQRWAVTALPCCKTWREHGRVVP